MRLLLLPIALLGCSDVVPERDLPMADARPPLFGEDAGLVAPPEAGPEDPRMQLEPEQRAFFLRLHDDAPPPLELKLDRAGVEELFGPIADDIELLELDALPLLDAALERIRNACGGDWRRDDHNPRLDCSLTEEGREFAPGGPEQRLVRLLTMTPANADVEDTSVEFIQDIQFAGQDRALLTLWSGRIYVVQLEGGELSVQELSPQRPDDCVPSIFYTAVLHDDRLYATLTCRARIIRADQGDGG